MNSLFNIDNPIFRFLARMFDVVYLNILCLVCCIPIITIGPSITALYYCMLKISRNRDSSITSMFFHSFKLNLKQGVLLTIVFAVFAIVLFIDMKACDNIDMTHKEYIEIFLYFIVVLFAATASYAFPLLAQFDNTIIKILKNSIFMAIINFGYSFCIVAFNAIPIVLFLFLPELFLWTLPVWITFGFAIIAMINSKMFVKIFDKFISEN